VGRFNVVQIPVPGTPDFEALTIQVARLLYERRDGRVWSRAGERVQTQAREDAREVLAFLIRQGA